MSNLRSYYPLWSSVVLLCLVVVIIYPHYCYYVDPDGTAYLIIARRYASGDFARAVNSYWSPWSCWLTAPLIKAGLAAIPASMIINTTGAAGLLFVTHSLFNYFHIIERLQWLLMLALSLFLCYAVYAQSFDDLWACFFLLSALRLLIRDRFTDRPALWVIYGAIGTLAYFAKAYSFPFFILSTLSCTYFLCSGKIKKWLLISAATIGAMLLCSLPWIMILHSKYGIWTTSTAGSLNMSWYLVGHQLWKDEYKLLLPPTYSNSPYCWEDPYIAIGNTPHFWSSWHLAGVYVLRIGYNVLKFLGSGLLLSVFFPLVWIYGLHLLKLKNRVIPGKLNIILLSFAVFPLGYLMINFESRYIWYMLPISMLIGALFLQQAGRLSQRFLLYLFFTVSFLVYPIYYMVQIYNSGKTEYKWAKEMKSMGIDGSFTAYCQPGSETRSMAMLAYFSGNPFYQPIPYATANIKMMVQEVKRYHIHYIVAPISDRAALKLLYATGITAIQVIHGDNDGPDLYVGILP